MAEKNNPKDQEPRSWGEKAADWARKQVNMEVKPKPEHKTPEEAAKFLRKRRGRP